MTETYNNMRGDYLHPPGPERGCTSRVFSGTTDPIYVSTGQTRIYGLLIVQGAASAKVTLYDARLGESISDTNRKLIASVSGLVGALDGFILPVPIALSSGAVIQADQTDCIITVLYLP